jgi:hypothetical protein
MLNQVGNYDYSCNDLFIVHECNMNNVWTGGVWW